MLFIASSFSYGDRVALSFAGPAMEKELALDPVKLGFFSPDSVGRMCSASCRRADCSTASARSASTASALSCWSVCALLIGLTGHLAAAWVFSAIFVIRLALRTGAVARLSRQRAHCCGVVSHRRARRGLRHLQCFAVLFAVDLRSAFWMAYPCLWLAKLFLVYGSRRIRACVCLVEAGLQRQGPSDDLAVGDRVH